MVPSKIKMKIPIPFEFQISCEICDAIFYSQKSFLQHRSTHYGFICNLCDSKFDSKIELKAHVDTEHGGNCYKCGNCETLFPPGQKRLYRIHRMNCE